MKGSVQLTFNLPVKFEKKGKWIEVSCPVLDVITQGENMEIAKKNIIEALTLFLTTCYEMGTLDDVLLECGFTNAGAVTESKKDKKNEKYVAIPLYLIHGSHKQGLCHA